MLVCPSLSSGLGLDLSRGADPAAGPGAQLRWLSRAGLQHHITLGELRQAALKEQHLELCQHSDNTKDKAVLLRCSQQNQATAALRSCHQRQEAQSASRWHHTVDFQHYCSSSCATSWPPVVLAHSSSPSPRTQHPPVFTFSCGRWQTRDFYMFIHKEFPHLFQYRHSL